MALLNTQSQRTTLYSYNDIRDGVGYADYYLYSTKDDDGESFRIGSEQPYSRKVSSDQNGAGTKELNFDSSTFNAPKNAGGTAVLYGWIGAVEASGTAALYITVKLYHVSAGATETQMGSTWTSETVGTTGPNRIRPFIATIPITTTKHFKIGEKLRVEIILNVTGAAVTWAEIGHDPQNRDGNYLTAANNAGTILKLRMPYRLEI